MYTQERIIDQVGNDASNLEYCGTAKLRKIAKSVKSEGGRGGVEGGNAVSLVLAHILQSATPTKPSSSLLSLTEPS